VQTYIDIADVSLTYPGQDGEPEENEGTLALQAMSIRIARGDCVAVVGPSGCGKSTLLKLVSGLHPHTAGTAAVDGRAINGPLKIVGMAFQNPTLLPWRTALDNVLLPLEVVEPQASTFARERAKHVEAALRLLKTVGLGDFAARYPWQLSGGMQQRVSLCRALIHAPDILLLDEPFGALDAFTREELWAVLEELWLERRFTMILVTHDLTEAALLADTVHVMSQRPGRIVYSRAVELPRPRSVYAPQFVDLVHELRDRIGLVRPRPKA
jgi:NitT/TauT family transport system ATP-binding protein